MRKMTKASMLSMVLYVRVVRGIVVAIADAAARAHHGHAGDVAGYPNPSVCPVAVIDVLEFATSQARAQAAAVQSGVEAAERHHQPLREAVRLVIKEWEAHPDAMLPDRLQAALFNLKGKL